MAGGTSVKWHSCCKAWNICFEIYSCGAWQISGADWLMVRDISFLPHRLLHVSYLERGWGRSHSLCETWSWCGSDIHYFFPILSCYVFGDVKTGMAFWNDWRFGSIFLIFLFLNLFFKNITIYSEVSFLFRCRFFTSYLTNFNRLVSFHSSVWF